MTITARRACAAVLGLSAAYVGGWALVAPHSFFDSFPLPGHHWVAAEPPYNEHLVRDVGGLYLALCAVTIWAIARTTIAPVAGLAWEVFSVPHLIFHIAHLDGLATADRVGNVVTLGGTVVLAAVLLVPARRASARTSRGATA